MLANKQTGARHQGSGMCRRAKQPCQKIPGSALPGYALHLRHRLFGGCELVPAIQAIQHGSEQHTVTPPARPTRLGSRQPHNNIMPWPSVQPSPAKLKEPSPQQQAPMVLPTSDLPSYELLSSIDDGGDVYQDVGTSQWASELTGHPVMQLIARRAEQGSTPGQRAPGDTAKLGLVVEGGGMRGVISGAMLMALHSLGLRECFDVVYGASAGAINSTFFMTGQQEGLEVYSQHLPGDKFIDLKSLWRGGPLMNLSYLLEHVMEHITPLDWDKVLQSPLELKIAASSLRSLSPVLLSGWETKQQLVEGLKASATVPQLAGPPREIGSDLLVDAAVFQPVPLRLALADGCSHVLVLCTRPATLHTRWRRLVRGTLGRMVKRTVLNAPYMRAAWDSPHSKLVEQDEELVQTLATPPEDTLARLGAYVLPVFPETACGCHPLTQDVGVLRAAEAQGWQSIAALWGHDPGLLRLGLQGGRLGRDGAMQPRAPHLPPRSRVMPSGFRQ
ncbi:acyl transferase/acyl hydrolase/lysophospholipase [Haematococcus lacustris]